MLIDLIEHFSQYCLSNSLVEPDILGQAYEYLIKHFADLTNKKAGVALTVIRKIEQGEENLSLSKVNQFLQMFGQVLGPVNSDRQ